MQYVVVLEHTVESSFDCEPSELPQAEFDRLLREARGLAASGQSDPVQILVAQT